MAPFDFQFERPELLWLLVLTLLLSGLFGAYLLWKVKAARRIGEPRLVAELLKGHSRPKTIIKFSLLLLAFALGCIAVANPRKPDAATNEARKGIDVIVALDVSNSMLATDLAPNRLTQAKALVSHLLNRLPNDRVGLVVFAGQAYVQVPLTYDHTAAQMFLEAAHPGLIEAQGTALSEALEKAEVAFNIVEDRYKAIILITDGENHDENALEKAGELASRGILVNTVGVGSPQGATIVDPLTRMSKKDAAGNLVISTLNEPLLQQIAAATRGEYIHLQNPAEAANAIAAQLATAEKKALVDTSLLNYRTLYLWFALPMLLLLLAEVFFPDRKKVKA